MKDRFDVQLGVARPVELGTEVAPEGEHDAPPEIGEPMVVVEYRNRGIPVYLMPPLLIVLAALGIMSYQNLTTPSSLRPVARTGAALADASTQKGQTEGTLAVAKNTAEVVPPRPPIPGSTKPTLDLVETSAEEPAPSVVFAVPSPITGPAMLFEHETAAALRPVGDGEAKRAGALTPEPPLVPPASEP